ncbi:hypothetical protein KUCAC02_015840 [Chaenocephalus aceratus]|uniref:Uncharacterized protein n=1 Tax=Chaenocephalus aceratus TaxID=36190 RepID=A0ACB9Y0Z2_CHAAC|nr:hypothetical protein KUCAC02_015840 [Chaenocephalus aceratus]
MVRDNLDRKVVQSRKQNHAADTQNQSQPPEESAAPERARSPERVQPESQEPTERQLDVLLWQKLNSNGEPGSLCQPFPGVDAESLPTHLRPFSSAAEYRLVKHLPAAPTQRLLLGINAHGGGTRNTHTGPTRYLPHQRQRPDGCFLYSQLPK